MKKPDMKYLKYWASELQLLELLNGLSKDAGLKM